MEVELSSPSQTVFIKYVLPVVFFAMFAVWGYLVFVRHSFSYAVLIGWGAATGILTLWSYPTSRVWLSGETLLVERGAKRFSIKASELSGIYPEYWNRTPNVLLRFKRRTPFGRFVRIVVSWDPGKKDLRRVEVLLKVAMRGHDPIRQNDQNHTGQP